MRPLTSATSMARTWPAAITAAASPISTGISASRARWLRVPSGTMPSGRSLPARWPAAQLIVPSPPPATTASSPGAAAASSKAAKIPSAEISLMSASTPASAKAARSRVSSSSPSPLKVPPLRLTITLTFIANGNPFPSGGANPEGAEFVPLWVAEIGAVKGLRPFLAAQARRPFVAAAELDRLVVEGVDLVAAVHHDRGHIAVAGPRRFAVIRLGDRHCRLAPGGSVHGEILAELHQSAGADRAEQRVVEGARPSEVVAAQRDIADHR